MPQIVDVKVHPDRGDPPPCFENTTCVSFLTGPTASCCNCEFRRAICFVSPRDHAAALLSEPIRSMVFVCGTCIRIARPQGGDIELARTIVSAFPSKGKRFAQLTGNVACAVATAYYDEAVHR